MEKYLYLEDVAGLLKKSWSFCQKEVASGRLKSEKKYHLGKTRYLITEEAFRQYVNDFRDRVGNIEDFRISELSFELNKERQVSQEPREVVIDHNIEKLPVSEQNRTQARQIFTPVSQSPQNDNKLLEDIIKTLQELKQSGTDGNKLYVDKLAEDINILREEKESIKNEYEARIQKTEEGKDKMRKEYEDKIDSLDDKLKEEMRRVEKVYFISDRYDKVIQGQRELLGDMVRLSRTLSSGEKVKLGEIKKLLSHSLIHERVEIGEDGDIRFLQIPTDNNIENQIAEIDDTLELEKSRSIEIGLLKKKIKWLYIILLLILLVISFIGTLRLSGIIHW